MNRPDNDAQRRTTDKFPGDLIGSFGRGAGREDPRLGVIHLLVWVTCSAVYLAMFRASWLTDATEIPTFSLSMMSLYSLNAGALLGGLVLWGARRLRGVAFPVYPGEWLLIAQGVCLGAYLFVYFAARLTFSQWYLVGQVYEWRINYIIGVGVFLFPAVRFKGPLRWRVFFWSAVFQEALAFVAAVFMFPSLEYAVFGDVEIWTEAAEVLIGLLSSIVLVGAVVIDFRTSPHAPWPHWVGIGAQLYADALSLVWIVWFVMSRPAVG